MKRICTTLIYLFLVSHLFSQSTPEWKWIHPRPQSQYVNWIKLIDASTWYAVGNYGMFLKTTNGGINWTTKTAGYQSNLYPGAGIMQNNRTAYFLNANTGFLGVQAVRGIAKTTNGGVSFDTIPILPVGTSGTVYGFYFIDNNTGYLTGTSTFKAMKTTNGGANWALVNNIGSLGSISFFAIYAADTNNIKIASTAGNVYLTTNAGVNWTTSNIGSPFDLNAINFINQNTGYICGWNGVFRYTTNGGINWSGTNPSPSSLFNISASASEVYVSGYSSTGDVYKSTDNGNTWTTLNYSNAATITGFLAFGFDKFGSSMAVTGTYGEMIKSTNNGANWVTMSQRSSVANMTGDLYVEKSNGRIIACGVNLDGNDDVVVSPDGGVSWFSPGVTANTYYLAIGMVNSSAGYLSGRDGYLFKTTNGGTSWSPLSPNPVLGNYWLQSMEFVNASTGWIVGGYPAPGAIVKIFKTTNAGVNWIDQPSSFTASIGVKVDMVDVNTGYMSYSSGLQKTTNGGASWNIIPVPPVSGNSYRAMKVLDANTVYIGGSNSQVYATTNGGTTWESLNFPVSAGTIFSTDWYDAQNGCASAVIGVVGKTTNRGQTWVITNNGGYTVYDTKMIHPDTMFSICGNTFGAMIMKYEKGPLSIGFTYENEIPMNFELKQNYPNPFNPNTTIQFGLSKASNVSLRIYDITGKEYRTEINNISLRAGVYKMNFDGNELSSGVYFYSLVIDGSTHATKKMILLK